MSNVTESVSSSERFQTRKSPGLARRLREFFDAHNVDKCQVLQMIGRAIVGPHPNHSSGPQYDELVGMADLVLAAVRGVDPVRQERPSASKLTQIFGSHVSIALEALRQTSRWNDRPA